MISEGTNILIPFIQQQPEDNKAPQYVQVRETNKSLVYLDTRSKFVDSTTGVIIENDIADMVFSTATRSGEQGSTLIQNCKRIKVDRLFIDLYMNNINSYNNTFYLEYNAVNYVVTIPEGAYTGAAQVITALLGALNVATGVGWITSVAYSTTTGKFTLAAGTGLPFKFLNTNRSLDITTFLLNIPKNRANAVSLEIGPVYSFYTRYIDIESVAITRYSKIRPSGNKNNSGTQIYRQYVDQPSRVIVVDAPGSGAVFNWERLDYLPQIDMQLKDEFGNKLIVQQDPDGPVPGFVLLTLSLEV